MNIILMLAAGIAASIFFWWLRRAKPPWGISTTRLKRILLWCIVSLLMIASPILLYGWVKWSASFVIEQIGVVAQPIAYEIRLIDKFDLIDSPMRRIYVTYQINGPLEEAAGKIERWADEKNPPWQARVMNYQIDGVSNIIDIACDPGSPNTGGGINSVSLWEDGRLDLMIRFSMAPQACGLPSNPFNYWIYFGY